MYLEWIDLSHNYLVDIHSDLLEHEQLKTLYLHSNYISSMKDVKKLSKLTYLRHVTLYANPIAKSQYIIPEQIGSKFGNQLETPCYRPCVMGNKYYIYIYIYRSLATAGETRFCDDHSEGERERQSLETRTC